MVHGIIQMVLFHRLKSFKDDPYISDTAKKKKLEGNSVYLLYGKCPHAMLLNLASAKSQYRR
jgi:hypothetical protein